MYKLKYTLLLPMVMMYAANACAMTRAAELGRRTASQLGQRAATSAPRFTPTAATLNRPYTTATPERVAPTWQQAQVDQKISGIQPLTAESTNRSALLTAQSSYQRDSGGSSFWDRYKKYGLSAAITGFWATDKATLKKRKDDAWDYLNRTCPSYESQLNMAIRSAYGDWETKEIYRKMKIENPGCVRAYRDYYSAAKAFEQAQGSDGSEYFIKHYDSQLDLLK